MRRVAAWLDHAVELGASGIALGPIFASRDATAMTPSTTTGSTRGSATTTTSTDLVAEAHGRGLRILLDGVFNHVGTDFPRYREAARAGGDRRRGSASAATRFETFEGHDGLITLNHDNPEVVDYVVDVMSHWLRRGADGWRLDAAYAVPDRFWAQVLPRVRARVSRRVVRRRGHPRRLRRPSCSAATFDSVTQYELWKAIWSSLNDGNFHELDHALRGTTSSSTPSCR